MVFKDAIILHSTVPGHIKEGYHHDTALAGLNVCPLGSDIYGAINISISSGNFTLYRFLADSGKARS